MSIFCWGRRYPNAPFHALGGCNGRLPPHWFLPNMGGLTGGGAHLNGFNLCEYQPRLGTFRLTDVGAHWQGPGDHFTGVVHVNTVNVAGAWRMELAVEAPFQQGGSEIGTGKIWFAEFPTGYPTSWPDTIHFTDAIEAIGWSWGGAPDQDIFLGFYSLIPPNSCAGV